MKIYRIEDSEGGGIFRGPNDINSTLIDAIENYARGTDGAVYSSIHPMPFMDDKLTEQLSKKGFQYGLVSVIFGFSSKAQINMWFPTDSIKELVHDSGFKVSVYEVDRKHFAKGNTQAVFKKDHATLIKRIDIIDI